MFASSLKTRISQASGLQQPEHTRIDFYRVHRAGKLSKAVVAVALDMRNVLKGFSTAKYEHIASKYHFQGE